MKKPSNRLRRLVVDNFGWKLLSVLIAVMIWALVASEPELSTMINVRLEYRNLPEDLEVAAEPVSSVLMELRGPSGALQSLGDGGTRAEVVLDMAGVTPGKRTFTIGNGSVNLPRGVRLMRARPSEVRFEFERRAAHSVPVRVVFAGEGVNGYAVAHYEVTPPEVRIAGPSSHVARINVAVTDPVDVSNVIGSTEVRVNAFVDDPYVRLESAPQVVVRVTMKKK